MRELAPTEKVAPDEVAFVKVEGLGRLPFSNIRRCTGLAPGRGCWPAPTAASDAPLLPALRCEMRAHTGAP